MSTIRIETHIDSETLFLPQLKPMVGKDVEIVAQEKSVPAIEPGRSDWAAVESAVLGLENYDFEAYRDIRNCEIRHDSRKPA